MIKKIIQVLFVGIFSFVVHDVLAVPAVPWPVEKNQPDGSKISVNIRGDESVHWMESADGYTLMYNDQKYVVYAQLDGQGNMVPSNIKFGGNVKLPANITKGLRYSKTQVNTLTQISKMTTNAATIQRASSTTGTINALCVLAGFKDKKFTKTQAEFNALMNQVGYTAGGAKGSVRDYYLENSYGLMTLQITVVGPVTVSQNVSYYGTNSTYGDPTQNRWKAFAREVVDLIDPSVDFSRFASGGQVGTFHIIFAGYGDESIDNGMQIWSHAWYLDGTVIKDGVQLSRYSCSPELRGSTGSDITYIGVIAHELGHVFGSPDYYDTDYAGSGGNYPGSGKWDLMGNGSWNDSGRQPAHINMFQKILYKWVTPVELTSYREITAMPNSAQNSVAYTIKANANGEMYVLENRQQIGFDSSLPGHGLLIWHVHQNALNGNGRNAGHPQELYPVAASSSYAIPNSTVASYGVVNSSGCPFPGTSGKTEFTDTSIPQAFTWSGLTGIAKPVTKITENANKTVSFNFMATNCSSWNNYEPNESLSAAYAISANTTYSAAIGTSTDKDYYKFTLSSISNVTVDLTNVPAGKNYDLQLLNSSGTVLGSSTKAAGQNESITVNSLAAGTYYVYVFGNGGSYDVSNCYSLKVTTCPLPAAPSGLIASVTCNSVTLKWNAVTGATSYKVEYKTSAASAWTTVSTTATTYTLNNLTANTIYNWRVTAQNSCGSSTPTNGSNFTTLGIPAIPNGLLISNITCDGVKICWNTVTGAISYKIEIKKSSATAWTTATSTSTITTTCLTLTGLSPNTTYNIRITAQNSCGSSSVTINFTTLGGPTAPSGLSASNITSNSAALKWNAVTSATSYKVEYKASSSSTWTTATASTTATSWSLSGLATNTIYNWRVTAQNNCGSSSAVNGPNFTTLPNPPTNVKGGYNTQVKQFTLSWIKSTTSGVTGYDIFYNGSLVSSASASETTKIFSVSGVTPTGGKTYGSFTIKAKAGSNYSDPSPSQGINITISVKPTVNNITLNSAVINWSAVSGAAYYRIYVKKAGGTWDWKGDFSSSARSATIDGLTAGSSYDVYVTSQVSDSNPVLFLDSDTQTFSTPSVTPPTNVKGGYNTQVKQFTLSWTKSTTIGITGYDIYYNGGSTPVASASVTETTKIFPVSGVTPTGGKTYSFTIKAKSGSNYSTSVSVNISIPAKPTVSNITSNSAVINWKAVSGAAYYRIYVKKAGGTWDWKGDFSSSAKSATVSGLTAGTSYEVYVTSPVSGSNPEVFLDSDTQTFTTSTASKSSANPAISGTADITAIAADIKFYPNPVNSILYIQGLNSNVEQDNAMIQAYIYNMSGGVVKVVKINTSDLAQIDVSNLPNGTYLLKIEGKTFKFIKQ